MDDTSEIVNLITKLRHSLSPKWHAPLALLTHQGSSCKYNKEHIITFSASQIAQAVLLNARVFVILVSLSVTPRMLYPEL